MTCHSPGVHGSLQRYVGTAASQTWAGHGSATTKVSEFPAISGMADSTASLCARGPCL